MAFKVVITSLEKSLNQLETELIPACSYYGQPGTRFTREDGRLAFNFSQNYRDEFFEYLNDRYINKVYPSQEI